MIHVPTSIIVASLTGGANAAGTEADPASLARAVTLALSGGAMPLILYKGGVYSLTEALAFTDTHSSVGSGRFIKLMNYPGETVSFSGGTKITGSWSGPDAEGKYSIPFTGPTRNLWVNKIRATRAKKDIVSTYAPGWVKNSNGFGMFTVATVGTCTISQAFPAVVTLNNHGLTTGTVVHLTTTGALPAGLTAFNIGSGSRVVYYAYVVDANTFRLSSTLANALAGTTLATTSAGSGVHTLTKYTPDLTVSQLAKPTDVEVVGSTLNLWKMWRGRIASVSEHNFVVRTRDWDDSQAQGQGYSFDAWSVKHLENAKEWVKDAPGNWYHDRDAGVLYYKPRAGEVMGTVEVIAGTLEQVITAEGSPDNKLHIKACGITIEHTTWLSPDTIGYSTCQGGIHGNINGTWGDDLLQMPGAVVCKHADIEFAGCTIRRTGGAGLQLQEGCENVSFHDGTLTDIGGNGVTSGVIQSMQTYVSPASNMKTRDIKIVNNLISYIGQDYWDGIGVFETIAASTEVAYNDITEVAYSGISTGWYWGNSDISADAHDTHIHHNKVIWVCRKNGDGGAIYALGKRPNGRINNNYCERKQWEYKQPIYLDNGSEGWMVEDNVSKTNGDGGTQWLQMQHGAPSSNYNTARNNWFDVGTHGTVLGTNTLLNNTAGAFGATALAIQAAAGRR